MGGLGWVTCFMWCALFVVVIYLDLLSLIYSVGFLGLRDMTFSVCLRPGRLFANTWTYPTMLLL